MCDRVQTALQSLDPQYVEVFDEGHMYNCGLKIHFEVVLISPQLAGLNTVKRH